MTSTSSHTTRFWRDSRLPFIEARAIEDGRQLCYGRHAHNHFSIGAVTGGQCVYLHEAQERRIGEGTVVLMNPGAVHACNPIEEQPWSYIMLYVDAAWLGELQRACEGGPGEGFRPLAPVLSQETGLFARLLSLYDSLLAPELDVLAKHEAAIGFFLHLQRCLGALPYRSAKASPRVERAAAYIDAHFMDNLCLTDICEAASLSEGYLIRAFEQRYHMTPHAYLVNRRVQHAQAQLREGVKIADTAQAAGFADQAHLQRAFKRHLAMTPGQYRARG